MTLASEESYLSGLAVSQREWLEKILWSAFVTQTWDLYLDGFPSGHIEIPHPPLQSATITYTDGDGASQTLSTSVYEVVTACKPGYIRLAYGQSWPITRDHEDSVVVRFVCGYGGKDDVPECIKTAIKLGVSELNENREMGISPATQNAMLMLCAAHDYSGFR